jgi:hypothetical protein
MPEMLKYTSYVTLKQEINSNVECSNFQRIQRVCVNKIEIKQI